VISRRAPGDGPASTSLGFPVLLYHSVSDHPAPGQERFTVLPRRFREHIGAIQENGRVAMQIGALGAALRGEQPIPARAVAVTFDDGFADTGEAVSALADAGITSTVFITSERVGMRGGIPASTLPQLIDAGAEIGAHTVTHPYLDELDLLATMREIRDGRDALEQRLSRPVTSFAYPHGAYDRRVRAAVIEAGFTAAAAVKNALSHRFDDPYAIARWTVGARTSALELERILEGDGARIAWKTERLRTRAYRGGRRARRRLGAAIAL
jgi:peptidoglycan/xylan/chitin deacetylase (PgdA/CDA1 family)